MANRTLASTKTTRCKATQSGQQCLRAKHSEMTGHRWGQPGETDQWTANGTAKAGADLTDDTPTEEIRAVGAFESTTPTTELALATPTGNGYRPQKYADLVRIAEKVDALRADVQRTIDLETELDAAADLLAVARAQEANGEVVDPSILHQLEEHHDRYAIRLQDWIGQRGLRKVEGAGS